MATAAKRLDRIALPTQDDDELAVKSPVMPRISSVGDDDDEILHGPPRWWPDVKAILGLAIPSAATQLFRVANVSVVLIMCGHLSGADFAGLTLGQSLTNIFVTSPGIGFSAMLDTLVTQEFGRDPTSPLMGLHLRRALVAGLAWLLVCAFIFLVAAEPLCVSMFGYDAGIAASKYLRLGFLPSAPMVGLTCIQKFLSAQGIVDVALWAQAASIVTLIACLSIAVPYGLSAVAIAALMGRLTSLIVMVVLGRRRSGVLIAWGSWSFAEVVSKAEFCAFLKHSIPSVLTTCAERWTFDTLTVLAGLLGVVSASAWGILLNLWVILFSPCVGFYTANSTLVGNAVGSGRPYTARRLAHRGFVLHVGIQLVLCGILWQFPRPMLWLYVNKPEVIAVATAIAPLLSIAIFSDTTSYALQAALRGASDLRFVAWLTLFAQWGMSFTISAALMYSWWSISAVATGVALGSSMQLLGLSGRLQKLDWQAVVRSRHFIVSSTADDESTNLNDSMSTRVGLHEEAKGDSDDDEGNEAHESISAVREEDEVELDMKTIPHSEC